MILQAEPIANLDSYSHTELTQALAALPALRRYYDLLNMHGYWQQEISIDDITDETLDTALLSQQLRLYRHRAWSRCALAEYFQKNSCEHICYFWSQVADYLVQQVHSRFAPENLAVFAYGKWGAGELNLSSDIDLVLISEQDSRENISFVRKLQTFLHEPTDCGFCFRLDFDLRPGGRMGQMVTTVEQFSDYYGNYGEAWERLAFVRLRAIVGTENISEQVYKFVNKFCYRRHLDYSLLSDLKILRQRIHSHYNIHTYLNATELTIDLKLGIGGIRDLELFVHTLQVVHGGKDKDLRHPQTGQALTNLREKELLPKEDVKFLLQHYWDLRHYENLAQAYDDQQTHLLHQSDLKNLICQQPHDFEKQIFFDLNNHMQNCDTMVSGLLGKVDTQARSVPDELPLQQQWLRSLKYSERACTETWPEIIQATALSRQKERDEFLRKRFLFLMIEKLAQYSQTQDRGLGILADFLKATRAKATFFSLLLSHENLIDQVAKIFATSPYLSGLLCARPELLDSYVYRAHSPTVDQDLEGLLASLSEKKLLSELIDGAQFLQDYNLQILIEHQSETADDLVGQLLSSIEQSFNNQLEIVRLGKWGGQEMGVRSDLDFIFVTEQEPTENDMRSARKFFHALTFAHHKSGALYSVDLRLKPSGKGGLVVTSKDKLLQYLSQEAPAWERQAYLRCRPLGRFLHRHQILQACFARPLRDEDLLELKNIRQKLLRPQEEESIDLKYVSGGLVDIEFAVQVRVLKSAVETTSSQTEFLLREFAWHSLAETYQQLRKIEQVSQLLHSSSTQKIFFNDDAFSHLSQMMEMSSDAMRKSILKLVDDSQHTLKRLDPRQLIE